MKKNDLILFFTAVLLGVLALCYGNFSKTEGDTVIITKNGKIYGEYPLSAYAEIPIDDTNTVRIENGTAYMFYASCPDKLCIRQGKVKDSSKKIVCLPNRVTVEVTKKSEIDKVVR